MSLIPFTHLHVHSQYSVLDGQASVSAIVSKAAADGMKAVALTDHGTMLGIKEFYDTCKKKGVKPIIGVEAYVAERSHEIKLEKVDRSGRHLILLAKNKQGYKNLIKLISKASIDGMFYRPRIDKDLLLKHHEGLMVTSACLGGKYRRRLSTEGWMRLVRLYCGSRVSLVMITILNFSATQPRIPFSGVRSMMFR